MSKTRKEHVNALHEAEYLDTSHNQYRHGMTHKDSYVEDKEYLELKDTNQEKLNLEGDFDEMKWITHKPTLDR